MKTLGLFLMIAIIVEALVEYGQTIYDMVEIGDYKKAIKQGCAIVIAVLFAFMVGAQFLNFLLADYGRTVNAVFDMIVTGIFLSRGANYVSELYGWVMNTRKAWKPEEYEEIDEDDEDYDEDQDALMLASLEEFEEEE